MKPTPLTRLVALGLLAASLATVSAQDADAALNACFREYLDQSFAQRPLEATKLGDHRFDAQLDAVSPAARANWTALTRRTLAALPQRVEVARLSPAGKLDYEILRHELSKSLWQAENTRPFEDDPRVYSEFTGDSVFLLLAQSSLPKETNLANAIARMEQIPALLAVARTNLQRPPLVFLETAIRQNAGAIAFYERDLFALAGKSSQLPALRKAAERVIASLREHQRFIEQELRSRADGEWRIGREKFARKLELELDAGLTADQVLADAEAEFVRVEREMYVIAKQLWSRFFQRQALPPDDDAGRRDTIRQVLRQVGQEHGEPRHLVRDVRETVTQVKRFLRDHDLLRLPNPDRCQIIEMPEFQRGNSTAYMNAPPPLDPNASGFYAVSPPPKDWDAARVKSYLEEYNRHMLQILTIHEAYPGHYVQLAYANRHPSPIRRVLQSGVYVEGWAVYTEQTMLDQGYGQGDLALRLTQLKFYLRAVANALLDHRMHCAGMTDEEAMRLLVDGAFQSEGEARLKVIRAKQSSVQLSTYFVGRMAMYRLRQQIERELGERFELGRYHEAVLEPGPVPVKFLPELVRARLQQPR